MSTAEQIITFAEIKTVNKIFQGEIWLADLGNKDGCIQGGKRPVIVLQNDIGNKYSPTTIVVPLTSKLKNILPVHIDLGIQYGLTKVSTALTEQITTVNKYQLINKIGVLNPEGFGCIRKAIIASLKGFL